MSKNVIVYGNGASAKGFLLSHQACYKVIAFATDEPADSTFEGHKNISTEEIKQLDFDAIIVASWAIHEITERLVNHGVPHEKIRWFQHHKERIIDWGHPDFNMSHIALQAEDILYCIYDLNVARATYDILGFLCLCECERVVRGSKGIHIIIVNASDNEFNQTRWVIQNTQEHNWRVDQILVQCCSLLPHCVGVSKTATRSEVSKLIEDVAHIFPHHYSEQHPVIEYEFDLLFERLRKKQEIAHLKANSHAMDFVRQYLNKINPDGKKVVTISLRESSNKPLRNSNPEEWQKFAHELDHSRYLVVLVPDTENAFLNLSENWSGCFSCSEAAFNVQIRMALYELSYINLGVNNGPTHLCALNPDCRYIMYKQVVENYPHSSTQSFIDRGFEIGGSFPGARPWQKFVWEDDSFEVISANFRELVSVIESSEEKE
ncbi:nucleoside-diphosphate sugar epimerase/dehydratase [Planctobacterium marinum]|uniref:Uncharacterized protein n=1 Tax=Planctobacterium marinum TaxID=1631968 RepID=A0AA48I022_9ALTE|nr:hypothetical protein MACH26_33010 [Planctobacterium marinum]